MATRVNSWQREQKSQQRVCREDDLFPQRLEDEVKSCQPQEEPRKALFIVWSYIHFVYSCHHHASCTRALFSGCRSTVHCAVLFPSLLSLVIKMSLRMQILVS